MMEPKRAREGIASSFTNRDTRPAEAARFPAGRWWVAAGPRRPGRRWGGAGAANLPTRSPRHPPACGTRGSARRPPAWRHPPVTAGSLNWGVSAAVSARDEDVGHFDIPDPMEESTASLVSSSTSAYASFPVDVVVYVRVQVSAECVRFPERGSLQRSSLGSLGRVCLSRLGGRQDPRQGYVQLHVCISAEEVHRALGFQNSNPIHLWQKL